MRAREEKLTTTAHKYVEVIIKILMLISKILMVRKKNSDGQNFSNQHQNSAAEHQYSKTAPLNERSRYDYLKEYFFRRTCDHSEPLRPYSPC